MAVFGPLKTFYRQQLSEHVSDHESIPIAKRIFLECYARAREISLTSQNLRSGWRGSGLWPVNRAVPLLSPLLIQKPKTPPTTPKETAKAGLSTINTPSTKNDLKRLFSSLNTISSDSPQARLIQRKIQKQIDTQTAIITLSEMRTAKLESEIYMIRPKKRAKVISDPNSAFIRIIEVEATRRQLDEQLLGYSEGQIIEYE